MNVAAANGCNYFTFNVKNTVCNDCGYISKHTLDKCPHCGSTNLDYLTRVIGYLKRISSFAEPRQIEAEKRAYAEAESIR
jgi:ribonucleoside-triphosphate reductase